MPTLAEILALGNTPLMPPVGQHLDDPALDRSPEEATLRGFGAGALDGLRRNVMTPIGLASMVPAVRGLRAGSTAAKALPMAAGFAEDAAAGSGMAGNIMRATRSALWGGDSLMPGNGPIEALRASSPLLPGSASAAGPVVRGVTTPSGITKEMAEAAQSYMRKGW
jgi:hypothetical protein